MSKVSHKVFNIFQGDVRCLKGGNSEDMSEDKEDEDNGYEYKDSMKPLRKKRRRTEGEKKEKLMNMSTFKKLMKSRARGDFEYNRNDDEY